MLDLLAYIGVIILFAPLTIALIVIAIKGIEALIGLIQLPAKLVWLTLKRLFYWLMQLASNAVRPSKQP